MTSFVTPLTSFFLFSPSLFCPQWCERNEQCRRLQLRDLLVAPLQRLTRYPLLLRNIAKRCQTEDETRGLQVIAEQVDTSICELHAPPWTTSLLLMLHYKICIKQWCSSPPEHVSRLLTGVCIWLDLFSCWWQAECSPANHCQQG